MCSKPRGLLKLISYLLILLLHHDSYFSVVIRSADEEFDQKNIIKVVVTLLCKETSE